MEPQLRELLDLLLRWVHVIAGIMWIGNSLLFNWLDRNLLPPRETGRGFQGEAWLIHSGGFYLVQKTPLEGGELPRPLHWFKWQAYTTWLSGACLLLVVYYVSGGALLVDPAVSGIGPGAAILLSAGLLVAGWAVYELIWAWPLVRRERAATFLSLAILLAAGLALPHVLSGRAAFLQMGAMLGTLMAGNVATKIMPAQRQLVQAVGAGATPDAAVAARAKQRSIHNNYMTFPVIVLMVSSHFPGLYGHERNWLVLWILLAGGAVVRHLMNIRFTYRRWVPALAATAAAGAAALYLAGARPAGPGSRVAGAGPQDVGGDVAFSTARSVIDRRCAACHSANPADPSFGASPAGVAFDTPEQILARADRILARAVLTETMPPGNKTWMTPPERELLRRWLEQGAPLR
ncbi:MAG: urate hydroxylase PuuD [Gemmatimonadetes bacterium]|nr:urate hydroxylase PuuD [Gemmatimonadota bacterium]